VLVDENKHIMATGYNGVPAGMDHCLDTPCGGHFSASGQGLDKCHAIHAEQNALMQCSDIHRIHSIYVTTFPCIHCAKMIMNTSVKYLYYGEEYEHGSTIASLLSKKGINLKRIDLC
jgi:dCMP deaminase